MKTLKVILIVLAMSGPAFAMPQDVNQMITAAENSITTAAESGLKTVNIPFGYADPDHIEMVAQNLRSRGYVIDEEALMLNPQMIRVQYLKRS